MIQTVILIIITIFIAAMKNIFIFIMEMNLMDNNDDTNSDIDNNNHIYSGDEEHIHIYNGDEFNGYQSDTNHDDIFENLHSLNKPNSSVRERVHSLNTFDDELYNVIMDDFDHNLINDANNDGDESDDGFDHEVVVNDNKVEKVP